MEAQQFSTICWLSTVGAQGKAAYNAGMEPMLISLVEQLESLYKERALLQSELNTSDADEIVRMVRSMEAQLSELYAQQNTNTLKKVAR
jgi:hypothetical protein